MSTGEDKGERPAPARRSWTDLGPRLASSAVLVILTALILYVGGLLFAAVVGLVFAGCYREWETMVARRPMSRTGWTLAAMVWLSGIAYLFWGWPALAAVICAAALVAAVFGGEGLVWRIVGLAFFGLVLGAVIAMRGDDIAGMYAGIFLGAVIWMTDSAAFFTGRQIGGEKLAPDISPSKTWSGALGGLALGAIAGTIAWALVTDSPLWVGAALALLMSVLGQLGDLAESAIKRRFRVKDSGDIIPGHGGLMDRLDSLTFGVLFLFAVGLMRGGPEHIAAGFLTW